MAKIFEQMGARALSADRLAHEAFRKGSPLYPRIHALFPERKAVHRASIAGVVFENPRKRKRLESLIHPYVLKRMEEELSKAREAIVVLEVPLLFESGFDRRCDRKVVVRADQKEVLRRLGRKGYPPREIRARWWAQMPVRQKIKRADYQIDNSDGLGATRLQVRRIWKELSKQLL